MKKLFIFITLILGLFLVSCTNESTDISDTSGVGSFLGYAQDFRDKIDQLMLASDNFNELTLYNNILDTTDNQYDMDDFRTVYENQTGMEVDINRVGFLTDYKDMLDSIIRSRNDCRFRCLY